MTALLAATGGFLLAVLWMDLMFDVQARRLDDPDASRREAALASIAAYYRRVTTDASPMPRLIGLVMLIQVVGIVDEVLMRPAVHGWRAGAVVLVGVAPIVLALVRVFPDAVRLGARTDPEPEQARLARAILRGHLACLVAIVCFVALQLQIAR